MYTQVAHIVFYVFLMATIGTRLKEARGALTMAKAAELVGISQQAWNLYEKDKSSPGSKLLIKICAELHVSADWLLGLIPPSSPSPVHVAGEGNAVAVGAGARASSRTVHGRKREVESCAKCPYKKLATAFKKLP